MTNATTTAHDLAAQVLADFPDTNRYCGPAHLCDAMSGCQHGATTLKIDGETIPARFHYCYRGGPNVRVLIYPYADRPQFAMSANVPAEMVVGLL